MTTVWRITRKKHAATAFDGVGASLRGGRWNPPGIRVTYTSETASLAVLEMLVHIKDWSELIDSQYSLISATLDDSLVETFPISALPVGWREAAGAAQLKELGAEWLTSYRSAVLKVPSAVIPHEFNYLINPGHAAFSTILIASPQDFEFDSRFQK
ncbi:MAG: RES family NAD+ phosphorylase [Fimbriiglobus sp.]